MWWLIGSLAVVVVVIVFVAADRFIDDILEDDDPWDNR